jgi:S-adenosylmethionine synthetase
MQLKEENPMNIQLSLLTGPAVGAQPVEIVERKGLGHPDTICDILAENLSRNLCRFYHQRFGIVLHHNVDKGLLFGGRSMPRFGGGEVLEPIELFLVGRATMTFDGVAVPVEELAVEGSRQWFREHFHALDPARHLKIRSLLRPGSKELTELYLRQAEKGIAMANDTSCGVGYAPYDDLEEVVLLVEQYLNSQKVHEQFSALGQDIKIMGLRTGNNIELTVACAFVDRYLADIKDYIHQKEMLADLVLKKAAEITRLPVAVSVNTADDPQTGSIYLTVTGTSGEAGDDGEVGRGNRVNGLITPYRPMNMEAAAGKNPVTHVGKIYNVAARRMAEQLVSAVDGVQEAYCFLVSKIGHPVQEPQRVEVKLRLADDALMPGVDSLVLSIVEETMQELPRLWEEVVAGKVTIC